MLQSENFMTWESGARIRIAMQKSGRMSEEIFDLLRRAGIEITSGDKGLLYRLKELPIDLLLVRNGDIAGLVDGGTAELGILGENTVDDFGGDCDGRADFVVEERLGFSRCRMAIAVSENGKIQTVADLNGKRIATSYPVSLKKFLAANQIVANIIELSGSVEIAPEISIADGIYDVVESGKTLKAHKLVELISVQQSEAVLVRKTMIDAAKEPFIQKLLSRIRGAMIARDYQYLTMNAPRDSVEKITSFLPGCESPTISPLSDLSMVSISAVCKKGDLWQTMAKLEQLGATSILSFDINAVAAFTMAQREVASRGRTPGPSRAEVVAGAEVAPVAAL